MFNLSGSEIIIILLLALVVLGPEKLPDAIRRFGRLYAELKRMSSSFQDEMRSTLDEPMREMRETADLLREQATFDADADDRASSTRPETREEASADGHVDDSEHGDDGGDDDDAPVAGGDDPSGAHDDAQKAADVGRNDDGGDDDGEGRGTPS